MKDLIDIEILQSLIQKAVRRGDTNIVHRVIQCLMRSGHLEWLKRRLPVLVFEECWTFGQQFSQECDEQPLTDQFLNLTRTIKNKNACGLGSLAYRLYLGDDTAIPEYPMEKDLLFVAGAMRKPQPFWEWANTGIENEKQKKLVENAKSGFAVADQPWDKAFMLAAVYLAVTLKIPETMISRRPPNEFPLWIAMDRHTTLGVEKITKAADQINLDPAIGLWLTFYFEGAQCSEMVHSPWWEQEIIWRMKKLGLTLEEGQRQYERLRPALRDALKDDEQRLREAIFRSPDSHQD